MKKLFFTVIITLAALGVLLFAGTAGAQTSYYELKLYNTANKLVTGKDVDLYQGVSKIYDLTESSSIPGVYTHSAVAHGEYDVYVNASAFKSGIWIGAEKVSDVVDLFRMYDPDPDTLEMVGHIKATSFEGDGSKLTGVPGSLLEANDDLELKADADSDQNGDIEFLLGDTVFAAIERSATYGDVSMVIGRRNSAVTTGVGIAAFDPGIQHHSSTSSTLSANWFSSAGNARQAYLQYNSILQRVQMGSASAGNPTGPNIVPVVIAAGGLTYLLIDTTDNVIVQGADANSFVPAGFSSNALQLQTDDTTGTISVAQISGAGARYAFFQVQDILQRILIGSTETGDPDGADLWPMSLIAGGQTVLSLDTLENVVIQGTANDRVAAAYTHDVFQIHADTSVGMQAVRIYDSGARYAGMEIDEINNIVKFVSTETGTAPGDSAYRMVFWVGGAGGNRVEISEDVTEVNNWLALHDVFSLDTDTYDYNEVSFYSYSDQSNNPSWAFGSYRNDLDYPNYGFYIWQYQKSGGDAGAGPTLAINDNGQVGIGTTAEEDHVSKLTVEGEVTSWNPVELAGGAWFGATRDTIDSIIPAISFSESGGDTAYYDLGMFSNAVRVDSVWLDVTTEDTGGDSARCVLGSRQVDFGEAYAGAFTTQNSSYADMGAGNLRTKLRFTTEIALDANHRLILKLYRDNSISNNAAAPIKLAGAVLFGKGLR